MQQEKTIPFTWEGWDIQDTLMNSYYNVEFTEDFGVFKKGDKFSSICVAYDEGFVEAYDEDGQVLNTQKYTALPC